MSLIANTAVFDFEVYVLMTMKLRLKMTSDPDEKLRLQNKLAEYDLTLADGERVHDQIGGLLVDEDSFFTNLRSIMGTDANATELSFTSVLWPEFDFKATADANGRLESARYWHTRRPIARPHLDSPNDVSYWSMDLDEFSEHFGPINRVVQRPLFDELLPAYEEHQFDWIDEYGHTRDYGAGFCWGLFMFVGQSWD
ncbi:hypothetical protein [Mycobacteroides chelonae]|uniref:hypothetical protein n=1 Tax=Mycobacteroides chelonae TaxID=1774 RepID=UPI0009920CFE|nr:hypothetical protein [Mycobacteroides chelonae]